MRSMQYEQHCIAKIVALPLLKQGSDACWAPRETSCREILLQDLEGERTRKTTQTGTRMSSSRSVMLMSITAARLICSLGVGISPLGNLHRVVNKLLRSDTVVLEFLAASASKCRSAACMVPNAMSKFSRPSQCSYNCTAVYAKVFASGKDP